VNNYVVNIWVVGGGQDPELTAAAVNDGLGIPFIGVSNVTDGDKMLFIEASGEFLADQQCILLVTNDTERIAYICDSITVTH
jgi:hypothetical protein